MSVLLMFFQTASKTQNKYYEIPNVTKEKLKIMDCFIGIKKFETEFFFSIQKPSFLGSSSPDDSTFLEADSDLERIIFEISSH
jgi:hypothetical protein